MPPATGLETEHYDVIFHHFAVRNLRDHERLDDLTGNAALSGVPVGVRLAPEFAKANQRERVHS